MFGSLLLILSALTAQLELPANTVDRFSHDVLEFTAIDSQVNNSKGVDHAALFLRERLESLGMQDVRWASSDRALTAFRRVKNPRLTVLFVAHFDTRIAPYEMQHMPRILRPNDPRTVEAGVYAPVIQAAGVSDDKAGSIFSLLMIEQLLRADWAKDIEIRAFFGADEEIGFKRAIPSLKRIADGADIALNYEPGGFDRKTGKAFIPRNVYGNMHLRGRLTGQAAHAFITPEEGRDAVGAFAKHVIELRDRLTAFDSPILINVSHLGSAERLNVITDRVDYRAGIRFSDPSAQQYVEEILLDLQQLAQNNGFGFDYDTRLKWPTHEISSPALLDLLDETASELGQRPPERMQSPARSYGSMIAGWDVPSLEAMGPFGFHYHSADEIVWAGSVIERAQLNCALIYKLASRQK